MDILIARDKIVIIMEICPCALMGLVLVCLLKLERAKGELVGGDSQIKQTKEREGMLPPLVHEATTKTQRKRLVLEKMHIKEWGSPCKGKCFL